MYSCRKVAEIICEEGEKELGLMGKANFNFHLFICRKCTSYQKQMGKLRGAIKTVLTHSKFNSARVKKLEDEIIEKAKSA